MLCMRPRKLHLLFGICLVMHCASWVRAQSLQFTGVRPITNQEIALSLSASPGRAYRIESAVDLSEWRGLCTFPTNTASVLQYTDSAAPYLDARYYRAVRVEGTNIVSGDHLVTDDGEVVIQPRNHATFVMQWKGMMI